MNRAKRFLKIVIPVVAIVFTTAFRPWDTLRIRASSLSDSVQQQVDSAIALGLDGIIVYVDQKGRVPEFYSAGWKNREYKVAADPRALFKIASISKLYIAVATVKLVNSKKLSLDKTLADYLPELSGRIENANQITLGMMLQHNHDEQAIYSSVYIYEHTGLLPGYQSIARYLKDIDTVVILFVNTSGGNSWATMETVYKNIVLVLRRQSLK